jgi:hypothetical protein
MDDADADTEEILTDAQPQVEWAAKNDNDQALKEARPRVKSDEKTEDNQATSIEA